MAKVICDNAGAFPRCDECPHAVLHERTEACKTTNCFNHSTWEGSKCEEEIDDIRVD